LGVRGDDVKELQKALGLTEDGVFGRGTALKVKQWQASNGLKADGSFGSASRTKLFKD
jgi:peptidoglycan L-alanyl-D-glutamate endopeptidase CwlK